MGDKFLLLIWVWSRGLERLRYCGLLILQALGLVMGIGNSEMFLRTFAENFD